MTQACDEVAAFAGGAFEASLNIYGVGGNCRVATQQVDDCVYVIGQDSFDVARYSLEDWRVGGTSPELIGCDDAQMAWELLCLLREGCFLWQCGGCSGWIFTSNRPRVGVLACSTCSDGGVDFRHADRHVGSE